jgi:Zn-dependent protease with chaperone function
MIRPISLFLLIGLFISNHDSAEVTYPKLLWLLLFLIIIPVISITVAQCVKQAKAISLFATIAILVSWLVVVYFFSWATLVQTISMNLPFVEYFLVVIPAIFWLLVLWFVTSPISNRLSWVSHRLRLDILLLLIPVFILFAVSNVAVLFNVAEEHVEIVELVSVFLLFALAPFFVAKILPARPIHNYELSSTISAIGQMAGIRQPKILVWDTHGRIMNALAIGVIFQPKTIVLTDKLIENLTPRELRAVAAHEFGHHKYWHIPFLIVVTITVLIWTNKLFIYMGFDMGGGFAFISQLVLMVLAIILVSKFFERQADAFSAIALSKVSGTNCVTEAGANSLVSALGAIAQTQNINLNRNDPLHGSIYSRQQNLKKLIGCSFSVIPIHKKVLWIKIIIGASFILGILI